MYPADNGAVCRLFFCLLTRRFYYGDKTVRNFRRIALEVHFCP
uniref:Uncharacterized protein n=1 Tax=uncultured bacterium contig00025 TaxID=1181514 RepID=A0A806KFM1_9BACT|nr:hypothetical protein [uncultured bacterium contig00025]